MNKAFFKMIIVGLFLVGTTLGAMAGDLDFSDFLAQVNISAEADFGVFRARLSSDFGVPAPKVEVLLNSVPTPADAYMCLKVSQVANKPVEAVVREFNTSRDKGWGVIARNLGIKPGSREFHALKEGKFAASDNHGGDKGKGHGKKK